MVLPTQNLLAWELSVTFLHLFVSAATLLRLVHRFRMGRMWWDDHVACVVVLLDIIAFSFMWTRFRCGAAALTSQKLSGFIYSAWFTAAIAWTIIWGSRLSLSLAIARIFPKNHVHRRFSMGLSIALCLSYTAVLCISALGCKQDDSEGAWYDLNCNRIDCLKVHSIRFLAALVTLDFTADSLLVVSPLVMLWRIKLPNQKHRLILILFSSSIISLLSSNALTITWFLTIDCGPSSLILITMFSMLQAAINILVCNLLIIIMLVYRTLQRRLENGPLSTPVTIHESSSNSLATQSGGNSHNNSTNLPSNKYDTLSTPITFTTVHDTFSRISSPPPASSSYLALDEATRM